MIEQIKQTRHSHETCKLVSEVNRKNSTIDELLYRLSISEKRNKEYIEQENMNSEIMALQATAILDIESILKSKMKPDNILDEVKRRLELFNKEIKELND